MPNPHRVENQACARPTRQAAPLGSVLRRLFGRRRADPFQDAADRWHDALIERVRTPAFYTDHGVPDTFEGRFDLLVLHVAVVLRALERHGADGHAVSQALVDTTFGRLDVAMRELGVSDIGVPKRMKRLAEAFKGRTAAYHGALRQGDHEALAAAVSRNVLSGAADGGFLAHYVARADAMLASVPEADLVGGHVMLPSLTVRPMP